MRFAADNSDKQPIHIARIAVYSRKVQGEESHMSTKKQEPIRRVFTTLLTLLLLISMLPQAAQAGLMTNRPAASAPSVAHSSVAATAQFNTEQSPAQPAPGQPDSADLAGATVPQLDCTKPIPGQKARLFTENELLLSYRFRDNDQSLHTWVFDNRGQDIVSVAGKSYSSVNGLTDVAWMGNTAADLNGDGRAETVSAVRDKSKHIGVTTNSDSIYEWYADLDAFTGDNLKWISAAAGNLDRASGDDEVVVAMEDDNNDLEVLFLAGNSSGQIGNSVNHVMGQFRDPDHYARGDVSDVAVATGDLNGDGYNNEVVTVFRDGNADLQAVILRRNSDNSVTTLWSRSWTNHERGNVARDAAYWRNKRPIDVNTGDFDGDLRDEVVIGFRSGDEDRETWNGKVQMLVLDLTAETKGATAVDDRVTIDDRVFIERDLNSHYSEAATTVSVAGGDLDNDGRDEIALAYNTLDSDSDHDTRKWQQHLESYEYVAPREPGWAGCLDDAGAARACLQVRPGTWNGPRATVPFAVSEANVEALVVMDTGDIDLDGKEEIALARQDHDTGDLQIYTFDADSGLYRRSMYTKSSGDNRIEDFWLAMGDSDGDSWYGTYTGACRQRKDAKISAVLHAPPYWPEINPDEVEAGFGQSSGSGAGTGKTTETMLGASVTAKYQIEELGPTFSHEWEKTASVGSESITTTVEGTKFATHPPYLFGDEAYFEAIEFVETPSWCYDYTEPHIGTMTVCLPRPQNETSVINYPLEWWYEEGPLVYPESWVPVGINIAQGRSASQSGNPLAAPASRAVDGNTNGDFNAGSVAQTIYTVHPWWQVDLGGEQWLDAVQIWNRTDCCATYLTNYYVFVSNEPFTSEDPNVLLADPAVWHHDDTGQAGRPTTVPVNRPGRYVRIQLAGSTANYLNLAEVQVYGMPGAVDQWPTSQPMTTTDGFQLTWPGGIQQTVNGQVLYARQGSQLALRASSGAGEFDLGIAQEGQYVSEGSTADKTTLGLELRHSSSEVSTGTTNKNSYILSWSKEIEFSGAAGGLPKDTLSAYNYAYMPYIWLQRNRTDAGISQAYMVLDYWVPSIGGIAGGEAATVAAPTMQPVGVTPQAPIANSSTHPDPNTWVTNGSASFEWNQPPGDPAVVEGYYWYLDFVNQPDRVPVNLGPQNAHTYNGLSDGKWYFQVRALGDNGQWSDAATRTILVDTFAPQVQLAVDPPQPNGNNGWYVTPLTVSVKASDGSGSGVAAIEVSPDGVNWQQYTGPMVFSADTPGMTVYARATDGAGLASPVSTAAFKMDLTAPNSRVNGGQGPGSWLAAVITNTVGNQELMMLGAIADVLSGRVGMAIRYDESEWTSAGNVGAWQPYPSQPQLEANWSFNAGRLLGAGNHIFYGRSQDEAGNSEDMYEIGRVIWFPRTHPEIGGSTLTASPRIVRPGEVVNFTLVARNGGRQEAQIDATVTLPAGLSLITDTLAEDVVYDTGTGVITWPNKLLWPGDWKQYTFEARTANESAGGSLEAKANLRASWPNSDLLPPEQRDQFAAQERLVQLTATVVADPNLPAGADVTPPWATLSAGPELVRAGTVPLGIVAAPDVGWMYLREWTLDPSSGAWVVAQNSGWINYTPVYTWTLSAGQGVKYLGVWVIDTSGNLSVLDEGSMGFVNRSDGSQVLAGGQRVQYRGDMQRGNWVVAGLTTIAGDPDMYIWRPGNGFLPDYFSNDSVAPSQMETLGGQMVDQTGRYILEVEAVGDSKYTLDLTGQGPQGQPGIASATEKERPQQPLALSDPLSASQVGEGPLAPPYALYMPAISR